MALVTIDVKAAGIAQGGWNHGQAGSESNKCRCTDAFYIEASGIHPPTITSTLTVSTGKTVKVSLMTFETVSHTTEILTSGWQDVPYTMNISSSTASKYVLCEMRYSDLSDVTPDEILSWTITYDDGLVYHAHEGEYPVNDSAMPIVQTDFTRPFPLNRWRIDESNDGYPYTDLQLGILTYEPPHPPPPPPGPTGVPTVQPVATTEITDQTSIQWKRYTVGYTNPDLFRFRDGDLPENTKCDVFIKGTNSYRYTEERDHIDGSQTTETP